MINSSVVVFTQAINIIIIHNDSESSGDTSANGAYSYVAFLTQATYNSHQC